MLTSTFTYKQDAIAARDQCRKLNNGLRYVELFDGRHWRVGAYSGTMRFRHFASVDTAQVKLFEEARS